MRVKIINNKVCIRFTQQEVNQLLMNESSTIRLRKHNNLLIVNWIGGKNDNLQPRPNKTNSNL
jgi:hypothetical protein